MLVKAGNNGSDIAPITSVDQMTRSTPCDKGQLITMGRISQRANQSLSTAQYKVIKLISFWSEKELSVCSIWFSIPELLETGDIDREIELNEDLRPKWSRRYTVLFPF